MSKLVNPTIEKYEDGDPVNAATMNAPIIDIETGIAGINCYINSGAFGSFEQDISTTAGLKFGYTEGRIRQDSVVSVVSAGTVSIAASATNYIELDIENLQVVSNTTAFTSGRVPLWRAVTNTSIITALTDFRSIMMSARSKDIQFSSAGYTAKNVSAALDEVVGKTNAITNTELPKYVPEADFRDTPNKYGISAKADAYASTDKRPLAIMSVTSAAGWPSSGTVTSNWLSSDTCRQTFVSESGDIQIREVHTTSYPNWSVLVRVWTDANDGSGSGLDADKVDGIHGSQLLRSDIPGSISGDLKIIGTSPQLSFHEEGGDASEKNWDIITDAGTFQIRAYNDAHGSENYNECFVVDRSGTTITSITFRGQTFKFNDQTVWYAGNFNPSEYYKTSDWALNTSVNGHTKMPNGVIIQWGRVTWPDVPEAWMTVNFSTAFPNSVYSVCGSPNNVALQQNNQGISVKSLTKSSFQIVADRSADYIYWIAIGR